VVLVIHEDTEHIRKLHRIHVRLRDIVGNVDVQVLVCL
jgi:hypothetical protein